MWQKSARERDRSTERKKKKKKKKDEAECLALPLQWLVISDLVSAPVQFSPVPLIFRLLLVVVLFTISSSSLYEFQILHHLFCWLYAYTCITEWYMHCIHVCTTWRCQHAVFVWKFLCFMYNCFTHSFMLHRFISNYYKWCLVIFYNSLSVA